MLITEMLTDRDKLMIVAEFTHTTPGALFNYWIVPELLQKWWPPEAEVEPRLGGAYHLFWRQMNWHLHGHYTEFVPAATLAFTWQWDHYPLVKNVLVTFEPFSLNGTRMTLTHSPYGNTEQDHKDREGHREGWAHFIERLDLIV